MLCNCQNIDLLEYRPVRNQTDLIDRQSSFYRTFKLKCGSKSFGNIGKPTNLTNSILVHNKKESNILKGFIIVMKENFIKIQKQRLFNLPVNKYFALTADTNTLF